MSKLINNRVYVLTGMQKIRTTFGERYLITFVDDIFMPKRFAKEDEEFRDLLHFFVRINEDGMFGTKL